MKKAKKKPKRAERSPEARIIDKTSEPPIKTGRSPLSLGRERSPGERIPKSIDEHARYMRLLRNVAPFIRLPKGEPEPAVVGELMDFLKPFWGGEHEAEIWELYKRWARYADADEPTLRAEAERAGVSLREYVCRTALERIREYVNKRPRLAEILRYTSTSKPLKADTPEPQGGLMPAGLEDDCPQEPRPALGWIQGAAAELADSFPGTCRRFQQLCADRNRLRPTKDPDLELDLDPVRQQFRRYARRVHPLYRAVLKFMPKWATVAYRKHCSSYHAAEKDLDAAADLWGQLDLEANERMLAWAADNAAAKVTRPAELDKTADVLGAAQSGDWSRPMPLTEIASRVLKDPKKTRKLKSVYGDRIRKIKDKSSIFRLDGLPPNLRKELERA